MWSRFDDLPEDAQVDATTSLRIKWQPVPDATHYSVDIAPERLFGAYVWSSYVVKSGLSLEVPGLPFDTPFAVRVTAINDVGRTEGAVLGSVRTMTESQAEKVWRWTHAGATTEAASLRAGMAELQRAGDADKQAIRAQIAHATAALKERDAVIADLRAELAAAQERMESLVADMAALRRETAVVTESGDNMAYDITVDFSSDERQLKVSCKSSMCSYDDVVVEVSNLATGGAGDLLSSVVSLVPDERGAVLLPPGTSTVFAARMRVKGAVASPWTWFVPASEVVRFRARCGGTPVDVHLHSNNDVHLADLVAACTWKAVSFIFLFDLYLSRDHCVAMAEALKTNTSLRTLRLWRNGIGDDGCTALAEALKVNAALQELNMEDNDIGERGCAALAAALAVNSTIKSVFLPDNEVGDAGCVALAGALKVNESIQHVDLWNNGVRGEGCVALAEALKVNGTVWDVELGDNCIGDFECAALAEALKVNTAVRYVDLWSNHIQDAGCAALADALKTNTSVQKLNLEGNRIQDAGCEALAAVLKTNTALKSVNLSRNLVGLWGVEALAEAAAQGRVRV